MARPRPSTYEENPFLIQKHAPPIMQGMEGSSEDIEASDASDETTDSVERRRQAAVVVKHDMAKLERIIQEKGMKYRLIDRIGEGLRPRSIVQLHPN